MQNMDLFRSANYREQRHKWDRDIEDEYKALLKRFKYKEKYLAPLMFPFLETKRRHKDGIHLSEVSTPNTEHYIDQMSSHGFRRSGKGTGTTEADKLPIIKSGELPGNSIDVKSIPFTNMGAADEFQNTKQKAPFTLDLDQVNLGALESQNPLRNSNTQPHTRINSIDARRTIQFSED